MAKDKNTDLHDLVVKRLSLSKKFADKYQKEVKKWLDDYNVDSLDDIDDDDLHTLLQIPYIFATIESQLPSIFEKIPELIMSKRGKKDKDFTDFTNNVWEYTSDILKLEEKIENAGFNFLTLGQSSSEWGWHLETETIEQEVEIPLSPDDPTLGTATKIEKVEVPIRNEPYIKIHQHDRIYFSPESYFRTFDTENEIPYIITEELMTKDEIFEKYEKNIDEDTYIDISEFDDDFDIEKLNDGERGDLKRIHVFNYYGTLPKDESSDNKWRSWKVYHYAFCQSKQLSKPKVIENKPIALLGNYGTYDKFFRFGEPKVMRELEQDISLGRSMISDYRDKMATKVTIDSTTEVDEYNLKSPKKFALVRYTGNRPPAYMKPPSIPEAVMTALDMSKNDAQMVSAQLDIARGGTQSVVDTATGQKIFENANEKRINRKRKKIGKFIMAIAVNVLKLAAENWTIDKFAKITDIDPAEIQQKGLIEKLAEIDELYNINIDLTDVVTNKAAMAAQAIALYRETKQDPLVNQRETLRNALEIGFGEKDWERYFNDVVTPEESIRVIQHLMEMQLVPPEVGQKMMIFIQQQAQDQQQGREGRPATQDPTSIMQKSMPGSDSNQITSQNQAAYKQQGTPKGPQNA